MMERRQTEGRRAEERLKPILAAAAALLVAVFSLRLVQSDDRAFFLPLALLASAGAIYFLLRWTDEAFLLLAALFLLYPETSEEVLSGINRSPLWSYKVLGGLGIPDNFFFAVLAAYAVRNLCRRRWSLPAAPWNPWMAVFFLWTGLSLVIGLVRGGELRLAFYEFLNLNRPAFAYLMALSFLEHRSNFRRFGILIVVGAAFKGVEGVFRFLGGRGVDIYGEGVPIIYYDPGVNVLLLTALTLALSSWIYRPPSSGRTFLSGLALAPAAFSFLFSYRRAHWLHLLVAAGYCVVSGFRDRKLRFSRFFLILSLSVALFAALLASSPRLQERGHYALARLQSIFEADPSNLYRYYDALNALENIRESPWLGLGLGRYYEIRFGNPYSHAYQVARLHSVSHNSFLYVWLKLGLPGLACYVLVLVLALHRAASRVRSSLSDRERARAAALLGLLLGYLVYLNTSPGLLYATQALLFGTGLAYLARPAPAVTAD